MTYTAHVRVTLRPSILDPEGKAVERALSDLGMPMIEGVRTGSFFQLRVDAESAEAADAVVRQACERLLGQPGHRGLRRAGARARAGRRRVAMSGVAMTETETVTGPCRQPDR